MAWLIPTFSAMLAMTQRNTLAMPSEWASTELLYYVMELMIFGSFMRMMSGFLISSDLYAMICLLS